MLPLTLIYYVVITLRRKAYQTGLLPVNGLRVPVVVVGNITVGGTGKSPLVIALANSFKDAGYHPGILSRGYLGQARDWPRRVEPGSNPVDVGDEPVMIASRTACPVFVGPDRVAAAEALLQCSPECDLLSSDDGLQHYHLAREIEIAVVDGQRHRCNGLLLPTGPLWEHLIRLD